MVYFFLSINKQEGKYELFNVGYGRGIKIKDLVKKVIECSGKQLEIIHDLSKPTVPTSLFLDCTRAQNKLGWSPSFSLEQGINKTIAWYEENIR